MTSKSKLKLKPKNDAQDDYQVKLRPKAPMTSQSMYVWNYVKVKVKGQCLNQLPSQTSNGFRVNARSKLEAASKSMPRSSPKDSQVKVKIKVKVKGNDSEVKAIQDEAW